MVLSLAPVIESGEESPKSSSNLEALHAAQAITQQPVEVSEAAVTELLKTSEPTTTCSALLAAWGAEDDEIDGSAMFMPPPPPLQGGIRRGASQSLAAMAMEQEEFYDDDALAGNFVDGSAINVEILDECWDGEDGTTLVGSGNFYVSEGSNN